MPASKGSTAPAASPPRLGLLIESVLIPHTAYQQASKALRQALRYALAGAEPVCIAILGESRTGKTRTMAELVAENPHVRDKDGLTCAVLFVVTPSKPSAKNLAETILFALGDPLWYKGSEIEQTKRIVTLFKACGVRMLLIDEFQHFYDKTSHTVWHHVADWLKNLVGDTGVCVVTAGLAQSRAVIRQNVQLSGRFLAPILMPRFTWRSSDLREEFKAIVSSLFDVIEQHIELPDLRTDEMLFRLWCATGGLMGYLIKLLQKLLRNAEDEQKEFLVLADFAEAYRQAIANEDNEAAKISPFAPEFAADLNDILYQQILALGVEEEESKPPRARRRGKNGAQPNLGSVLRT